MIRNLNVATSTRVSLHAAYKTDRVLGDTQLTASGQSNALLMVADSVGRRGPSPSASQLAVDAVYAGWQQQVGNSPLSHSDFVNGVATNALWLKHTIQHANQVLNSYVSPVGMRSEKLATTATVACLNGYESLVANVGDCRAYLWRGGRLTQLTADHSLVAELERSGVRMSHKVLVNPCRSVVTRALGKKPDVMANIGVTVLEPGDSLLLCSDGLWRAVRDEWDFGRILTHAIDAQAAADQLVGLATARGASDDVSVAIANVLF